MLAPREKGHLAAIGPGELREFLRALNANEACMGLPVRVAMGLMLPVLVRTSELIETPWAKVGYAPTGTALIQHCRGKKAVKHCPGTRHLILCSTD